MALKLFSHAVKAADHDAIIARLAEGEHPDKAIASFVFKPGPAALAGERARIDMIFAAASVEAILERLDRDASPFAVATTAATMRSRSPTALKFIFRALREARGKSLPDCLKMEYRVASRAVMAHDFREGVRATLIDRDGKPQWQPASLAAVKDSDIAAYFAPLGSERNLCCDAFVSNRALLFVVHEAGAFRNSETIRDELRAFYTPLTPCGLSLLAINKGGSAKSGVWVTMTAMAKARAAEVLESASSVRKHYLETLNLGGASSTGKLLDVIKRRAETGPAR